MKLNEIAQPDTRAQIKQWLDTHGVSNYTINQDGTVDVEGDVQLNRRTTSIDVQFRNVKGNFYCYDTKIISLKGCPQKVGMVFRCHDTNITSLLGAPQLIGSDFYCNMTNITNLVGAPKTVGGSFYCESTQVASLEGCPQTIGGELGCEDTPLAKKHILQLLKYGQIKKVWLDNAALNDIVNRHLEGDRDILACQDELIDAGFGDRARL